MEHSEKVRQLDELRRRRAAGTVIYPIVNQRAAGTVIYPVANQQGCAMAPFAFAQAVGPVQPQLSNGVK